MKKFNWVNRSPFIVCFWNGFYDDYLAKRELKHISREEFEEHLKKCSKCREQVENAHERANTKNEG